MDKAEQRAAIDRYIAAYNAFDITALLAELHDEVVFQNVSGSDVSHETVGKDAFRAQAEEAVTLFRSREQTATSVVPIADEGDPGMRVGIDFSAVLARDLLNGLKAGDPIELKGESEFRFRSGKIVSIIDRS